MSTTTSETGPGPAAEWVKSQLTQLFASTQSSSSFSFESAFTETFTHSPRIKYNDTQIGLAELKEQLEMARFKVQSADVGWGSVAEHAGEDENRTVVFGSFTVTRLSQLRIRAGPAEHRQSVSFEAKVEKTSSESESEGGIGFKIAHLSITSDEEAAPVHLASIPGQTS